MVERPLFGESFQSLQHFRITQVVTNPILTWKRLGPIGTGRNDPGVQPTFVHGIPIFRGVQDHIGVDAPELLAFHACTLRPSGRW